MKIKNNKIIEATIDELRSLWLQEESLHELYTFTSYVEGMKNCGVKIIDNKEKK